MLTNQDTIQNSIKRLKKSEDILRIKSILIQKEVLRFENCSKAQ